MKGMGTLPDDIKNDDISDKNFYQELISKEASHWGNVTSDPRNPQIWDDEHLFGIFFGREYRHLVERVIKSGPRVLELGCGEGNLAHELAAGGMSVDAIDLSPERIVRARAKSKRGSGNPRFIIGDLNTLSLPPLSYNCIVAHDSLHHILSLEHLLGEVSGALVGNGTVLVMDYIGMGTIRKVCAAALTAVLPTYQSYAQKLKLATRFRSFMASESQKRRALSQGGLGALHQDSPFEEISQRSIPSLLRERFHVVEEFSFNPFWFYLAPKVRLPRSIRYGLMGSLRRMDDLIVQYHLARGAYMFLEGRKR